MTWTQVPKQVSGSQDFNLVHHDPDFAKEDGRPGVFMNTMFTLGSGSRVITDWIGNKGFLTFFRMDVRKINLKGDTMVLKGRVTHKYVKNGRSYAEADVWVENSRDGGVTTTTRPA